MAVGFLVAGLTMSTASSVGGGDGILLAGGLLAGVPILDTGLVIVSRTRRRVPLVTGGRDHLTHRILLVLASPRVVAATLALAQSTLCGMAIAGDYLGVGALAAFTGAALAAGAVTIAVLDTPRWRPAGIATGSQSVGNAGQTPSSVGADAR